MSEAIDPQKRRLSAKKLNESVKLAATSVNASALAIFGTAFILPIVKGERPSDAIWMFVAVGLHLASHVAFRFLRSEE